MQQTRSNSRQLGTEPGDVWLPLSHGQAACDAAAYPTRQCRPDECRPTPTQTFPANDPTRSHGELIQLRRRQLLRFASATLLLGPLSACRVTERPKRVGILDVRDMRSYAAQQWHDFSGRVQELGWVEGTNIAFQWGLTDGDDTLFPGLADRLVRVPVDVIVANGTQAALAAAQSTSTIPIVFNSASTRALGAGVQPGPPRRQPDGS